MVTIHIFNTKFKFTYCVQFIIIIVVSLNNVISNTITVVTILNTCHLFCCLSFRGYNVYERGDQHVNQMQIILMTIL